LSNIFVISFQFYYVYLQVDYKKGKHINYNSVNQQGPPFSFLSYLYFCLSISHGFDFSLIEIIFVFWNFLKNSLTLRPRYSVIVCLQTIFIQCRRSLLLLLLQTRKQEKCFPKILNTPQKISNIRTMICVLRKCWISVE